jgi:hypothetical protein
VAEPTKRPFSNDAALHSPRSVLIIEIACLRANVK